MTIVQISVIIIGLLVGYWGVSSFFNGTKNPLQSKRPGATDQWSQEASGASDAPQTWYEVLGIPSNAGIEEIRRAYKVLIGQYHPDKVATLGTELRDLAEIKSKQITTAYREAMRSLGVDL